MYTLNPSQICNAKSSVSCKQTCPRAIALLTTHIASYISHSVLQLTPVLTTHIASYNSHRFLRLTSLLTALIVAYNSTQTHIASYNSHRFLQLTSLLANSHRLLPCKIICVLQFTSLLATSHRFLQLIFLQPHIASYNAHRFVQPSISQTCSDWRLIVWSAPPPTQNPNTTLHTKAVAKWPPNGWQLIPDVTLPVTQ